MSPPPKTQEQLLAEMHANIAAMARASTDPRTRPATSWELSQLSLGLDNKLESHEQKDEQRQKDTATSLRLLAESQERTNAIAADTSRRVDKLEDKVNRRPSPPGGVSSFPAAQLKAHETQGGGIRVDKAQFEALQDQFENHEAALDDMRNEINAERNARKDAEKNVEVAQARQQGAESAMKRLKKNASWLIGILVALGPLAGWAFHYFTTQNAPQTTTLTTQITQTTPHTEAPAAASSK